MSDTYGVEASILLMWRLCSRSALPSPLQFQLLHFEPNCTVFHRSLELEVTPLQLLFRALVEKRRNPEDECDQERKPPSRHIKIWIAFADISTRCGFRTRNGSTRSRAARLRIAGRAINRVYGFAIITSVDLISAIATSPTFKSRSAAASAVMIAETVCSPSEITILANKPSILTSMILPKS